MNRPRVVRFLRIAWTVFCGLACVLLIALWVRSYWWTEAIGKESATGIKCVRIGNGWFEFLNRTGVVFAPQPGWFRQVRYNPIPTTDRFLIPFFGYGEDAVYVPIWSVVLLFAFLAAAGRWLPRRFTIRTLLIATTLVAVVLGLAVYAAQQ